MKWDALYGGPNNCLLTTSQLLIQIKMTLIYVRKYRIFTAIENYLNTWISQWNLSRSQPFYLSFIWDTAQGGP